MDAFKNLIRHGKNAVAHRHHHRRLDHPPRPPTPAPDPLVEFPDLDYAPSRASRLPDPPLISPPMDMDVVESIVREERRVKDKMPTYKGLEGYALQIKMGDGAFSHVYNAIELTTGRRVAVKAVRKYDMTSSQDSEKHLNTQFKKKPRVTERANILKEVQIMRGISHPSIVKLLSFSESSDHYFLVMELMEGGELFHQIVKLTYFSENLSRHVILQVAQGIWYLHEERGVVHRDIKPENILFERIEIIPSKNPTTRPYDGEKEDEGEFIPGVGGGGIGRVKIADFGLSKVVWNEETMTPCGTVGYTAPEIVKDERYSKSVDMWALGCVLYTLLCGFPPFYDESIQVLTEKVAKGHYTFLSPWWDDVSHSAKELITHLLCVDPAQRYTIDEFLAHPWCNAAPAPPPPPTPYMYPHLNLQKRPLDSPLLRGQGQVPFDGRSPSIHLLKEAFDVTYAVHRMEEEGRRRGGRRGGGPKGFLAGLNEDDEGDEDDAPIRAHGHDQVTLMEGRAGPRDQGKGRVLAATPVNAVNANAPQDRGRRGRGAFELQMDNATLLGRRQRGNVVESVR